MGKSSGKSSLDRGYPVIGKTHRYPSNILEWGEGGGREFMSKATHITYLHACMVD